MKKVKNENENGRSMIEMLGVLAIIGVLSVGGIAGYSKAMYRYRLNKTIEEITYSAGAVRSFFAPQKSYVGLGGCSNNNDKCTLYRKARLVPEDTFGEYFNGSGFSQGGVAHPFGGGFFIYPTYKINDSACRADPICANQAFHISITYLPQEACIDLLTQDWSNAGVSMIQVHNLQNPTTTLEHASVVPPVSIDHAIKLCEVPANIPGVQAVYFYFDADITQGDYKTKIDETMTALAGN